MQAEEFYNIRMKSNIILTSNQPPIRNSADITSKNQEETIMLIENVFEKITKQAQQIEAKWATVFQGLLDASHEYAHLDTKHFHKLNEKFQAALERLYSDLKSPTLILATTGTTSSGKSTIVNLLCGADLMPRMAQEMSAGVVYINHSPDHKKRNLKIHQTADAPWECGEWNDLSDNEIQIRLTHVMDSFNKLRGINQPTAPHIELTYPIACFSNKNLLKLTSIPPTTQFKIMDLPGLRNQQDNTNSSVIKNCRDALCLVAYNMEETDETRREALVTQVINQVKQMGGSPARMLFVLNRIDVFRKDPKWAHYTSEHIKKTKVEITDTLNTELPEYKSISSNLSYSPLSSLPALYAQCIQTKIDNERIEITKELRRHFNSLIPEEISDDLAGSPTKWNEQDFYRVSEAVWKNSYGDNFFNSLDTHIQTHFPTLVIPTIVQRFEEEVSDAIGDLARTCYSELNSSKEAYEEACGLLYKQNAELRGFIDQSKEILINNPLNNKLFTPKEHLDYDILIEDLVEYLLKTDIYRDKIAEGQLNPLYGSLSNLRKLTSSILENMREILESENPSSGQLPEDLQKKLSLACESYKTAKEKNFESNLNEELNYFLKELNSIISKAIETQITAENNRIRETMELLMTHYLNYFQKMADEIAPQWNIAIGNYFLESLTIPKIEPNILTGNLTKESKKVGIWYTLYIFKETIEYKTLPNSKKLYEDGKFRLENQIKSWAHLLHTMIQNYFEELIKKISNEQTRVLEDFEEKLKKANAQHSENYDIALSCWQLLHQESKQLNYLLKNLIRTGKSA